MENTLVRSAEDGFLYLIDLAGSENAGDSQFHDKSRLQETRAINTSLMCLKDCIRNRCQASLDPSQHVHIPYRQSKLSLLLKDAFELESFRKSRTVVIANVAPSLMDIAQTLNTLRHEGIFPKLDTENTLFFTGMLALLNRVSRIKSSENQIQRIPRTGIMKGSRHG